MVSFLSQFVIVSVQYNTHTPQNYQKHSTIQLFITSLEPIIRKRIVNQNMGLKLKLNTICTHYKQKQRYYDRQYVSLIGH